MVWLQIETLKISTFLALAVLCRRDIIQSQWGRGVPLWGLGKGLNVWDHTQGMDLVMEHMSSRNWGLGTGGISFQIICTIFTHYYLLILQYSCSVTKSKKQTNKTKPPRPTKTTNNTHTYTKKNNKNYSLTSGCQLQPLNYQYFPIIALIQCFKFFPNVKHSKYAQHI